jgi:hypothetical protein
MITVLQEKWTKAKTLVAEVLGMLDTSPKSMDRRRLEQIPGFLIYVVQTYREMTPYLIGLHMLTIDSWRSNRDEDGCRLVATSEILLLLKNQEGRHEGPKRVWAVPQLGADMEALATLLAVDKPKLKRVHCRTKGQVYYGFSDASGAAFGASFQIGDKIEIEYRQWCTEVTEVESSSWREANNLAEHLERIVKEKDL